MLHGSYELKKSPAGTNYQAGSCCNRWYNKMQIIVCGDATTGINFEHSAIDGHTALRFVSDIYAETVIKFARSITKIVHSYDMIPHIVQAKVKRATVTLDDCGRPTLDIFPKKISWDLPESVRRKIYAKSTVPKRPSGIKLSRVKPMSWNSRITARNVLRVTNSARTHMSKCP